MSVLTNSPVLWVVTDKNGRGAGAKKLIQVEVGFMALSSLTIMD